MIVLATILLASGIGGAGLAWSSRDPWPARVVIPHPTLVSMRTPGFTLDGRSFVLGIREVELVAWDVATGQPRTPQPDPIILEPVLAHDGRSFAGLVGLDPQNPDLVWADVASGEVRGRLPIRKGRVQHLAWSGDDRSIRALVLNEDRTVTEVIWNRELGTETRRPILGCPEYHGYRAIAPDGRLRVYGDPVSAVVACWDLAADRPRGGLPGISLPEVELNVNPVFGPEGRHLFVCRLNGRIDCWDVAEARLIRTLAAPISDQKPLDLAISPDGRTLAISSADRRPTSWIGRTWDDLRRWISPAGPTIGTGLTLIDSTSGQVIARSRGSYAAIFAPDSRSVATFHLDETISIREIPPRIDPPAQ